MSWSTGEKVAVGLGGLLTVALAAVAIYEATKKPPSGSSGSVLPPGGIPTLTFNLNNMVPNSIGLVVGQKLDFTPSGPGFGGLPASDPTVLGSVAPGVYQALKPGTVILPAELSGTPYTFPVTVSAAA